MPEIVLSADKLVKRFGGITATNDVTLHLEKGARHALIGPNGAGKTTLINLLTGVLTPTEGRISLLGEDITTLAPHKRVARGLVRTFQINQLFDSMTPLETLALVVSQHKGIGAQWWRPLGADKRIAERAGQLLEQFHLADVAQQQTKFMAYGKRRLLEIAIALACEPRVLLLDEPVAGVPAGEREELLQTVAAGIAGAAGALLAQTTGFASLDVLAFDRSADVLLMLVIGGVGWLYGGVAGAIVFKLLQTRLSSVTPQYWMFWIGLILVLLVLVGRDRLLKPWTWFGTAKKKGGAA